MHDNTDKEERLRCIFLSNDKKNWRPDEDLSVIFWNAMARNNDFERVKLREGDFVGRFNRR